MDISNASTGMVGRPFQVAALPALMDQDFIMETIASTRTPAAVGMRLGHTPAIGRRPGTQPQPELLLIGLRLGHSRPLGLRLGTQRRPLGRRLGLRPLHVGTPLGLRLLG